MKQMMNIMRQQALGAANDTEQPIIGTVQSYDP